MIVSQVTTKEVKEYLKIEDNIEDMLLQMILDSSKSYVRNYTGLQETFLDQHEDITIALLAICADMYSKREYTVEKDKINVIAKSILDLHSRNLL